jgi:plasmid stability protein
VSLIVHLPDELAARLEAVAAKRGVSTDELVAEILTARLPAEDALEAFIGSGASGRREPFDIHRARTELAERKLAEGL